ncbi:MAG: PAS domain-containing protein, partial [bacterium]|nr:PAS domain-containing protein [bacterium]
MIVIFENITERKQAEKKLKEAELRYRTVADFTYDWESWENPDGTLRYVSPACERITGYTVKQFMDKPALFETIILPADRKIWAKHRHEVIELPGSYEIQFRIRRRDGEIVWIEHACRPVMDEQGKFLGYRASNRDITERKRAEEEIEEINQRMTLAADSAGIGIWDVDLIKNELIWDRWMFHLFGIDPKDFKGDIEDWTKYVHPDDL